MRVKNLCAITGIILLLYSCQHGPVSLAERKTQLKDSLLSRYSDDKDSLQREAVQFLINNMDETQKVTYPFFYAKKTGLPVKLNLLKIAGEKDFKEIIKKGNILYKDTTVYDAMLLTAPYLARQIDKAFSDWKNYPWNKKLSKATFFEYLLPYKVFNDKPSEWRALIYQQKYLELLQVAGRYKNTSPEKVVSSNAFSGYKFIEYKDSYFKISGSNSFEEMVAIGEGDCITLAFMNAYTFRAMGIAATVDMMPLLGARNASHCEAVFCDSTGKMVPLTFRTDLDRKAKVFRYSYKIQKIWPDTIKPTIINTDDFLLPHLSNSHWIDVTSSYNKVAQITYTLNETYPEDYAYICVFNYGKWDPVFWGKKIGNKVYFKNMGTDIIYRVGVPIGKQIKFVSNPFLLTKDKKIKYYVDDDKRHEKIWLHNINTGSEATVKADSTYTLSYWNKTGKWVPLESKRMINAPLSENLVSQDINKAFNHFINNRYSQAEALKFASLYYNKYKHAMDSIEFSQVPKNTFLKLDQKGDRKHLSRIFLIDSLTHKPLWY